MEGKFHKIRRDLDSLGYFQILSLDSIPLVAKLLEDLKTTTGSLKKYMKMAQTAIKEKEDLELSLGPQKLDNEKLVRECNDLHLTFLNYRSQKEKDIKDLRDKVLNSNEENAKLILENEKLRTSLRETELDLMKSGTVTKKSQQGIRGNNKSQSTSNHSAPDEDLLRENVEIRHELDELKKELKNLQCKCRKLGALGEESSPEEYGEEIIRRTSTIDYKYSEDKIRRFQEEIHNLQREKNDLEKTYKEALSRQHEAMKRAIHLAERNKELEKELKDIDQMAIAVEEECNDAVKSRTRKLTKVETALKDALQEIQTLERTIAGMKKDKEESELNNDILKTEKKRMQDALEDAVKEKTDVLEQMHSMKLIEHDLNLEIDRLVQESAIQKRNIAELESKIVVVQAAIPTRGPGGDGVAIQAAPVTIKSAKKVKGKKTKKEKKKPKKGKKDKNKGAKKGKGKKGKKSQATSILSQVPLNSPTDVEIDQALKDLFPVDPSTIRPPPIPLLPREGTTIPQTQWQRPPIQPDFTSVGTMPRSARGSQYCLSDNGDLGRSCASVHPRKPVSSCECLNDIQPKCCMEKSTLTEAFRSGCCENMCLMHFRDLMKKEMEQCEFEIKQNLLKVTQERNQYIEEYHKLVNQMCHLQSQTNRVADASSCPLCPKIQQVVEFLQQENKMLSQEKMTLVARLEQTRNDNEIIGKCNKSSCKRLQRERDLFKADIARLTEECDCLRDNLELLSQAKSREHDTLTQQINNYERQMKRIESERSELMSTQGSRRAQLSTLEEKNEMMKDILRSTQEDLQNQRILYSQLKNLQEQTDKSLHDTQGQLVHLERELAQAYQTIEQLKRQAKDSKRGIEEIDLNTMKRQLNRMDTEKDDLLNIVDSKTEEIAYLKKDIRCKCDMIDELQQKNAELMSKMGNLTDRTAASSAFLKETEAEISRLQKQLDNAVKTRDNALEVNRKLQDELAAVSSEANTFKTQLTRSQEQIENLKLQSQQYIAEVKRAEDLIEGKEKEREDLLNQFKQLCLETNHLQSSNSALESEANQSKVQLSVAMDHVHDLEQKSDTLETLINDYEKQIGLLTNQIAKFESERNQHMKYQDRTEAELRSVRELCMKLDKEKEQLRIQLLSKETAGDRMNDLRRETDNLNARLTESQTKLANTERLLKEARHQGVEMKLKDEDALNEIILLKERIDDLEKRLFRCTCDECTEKCLAHLLCEKECIKGQIMNSANFPYQGQNQGTALSSLFDSSTPASLPPTSESGTSTHDGETARNEALVATAQVFLTDKGDMETVTLNLNQNLSPKDSALVSISSVRINVNDGDGEVSVQARSVKGVMTARIDSVRGTSAPSSTRDAASDRRPINNVSGSSKKFTNGALEMEKLNRTLVGSPGKYCKTGKCYPECRLFDPLNRVCGKRLKDSPNGKQSRSKNYNKSVSPSKDGKGSPSPCCHSNCCCAKDK